MSPDSRGAHRPPRLARLLLDLLLRGDAREAIVGDLDEAFVTRMLPARGPRAARRWYWDQTVRSIAACWRRAPRRSPRRGLNGDSVVTTFWQDVRYGARTLRRAPGFAAVAIATLAIGIGGTTSVFSVLHAVLLRPLPYAEPDRLVAIGHPNEAGHPANLGFLTIRDWRDRTRAFEDVAAIRSWLATLTGGSEPERVPAVRVSWNFFRLLGVVPALGRDFQPEEDRPEAWRVVLLSDGLWRRRFGANPAIVGRAIHIHGRPYLVAGVMPASLEPLISAHYYQPAEIWAPIGYDATLPDACRGCQHLNAIARLRRGVSLDAARAELEAVQATLQRQFTRDYGSATAALRPLRDQLLGDVRPMLTVLFGAVSVVLLIGCVNLASLLLARGVSRERELAVRTALGASRRRLVRQLLTESLLLSTLGGVAGLALAAFGTSALLQGAPADVPRLSAVGIDASVLAFSLGVSLLAGLAFGLAPAVKSSPRDPHASLRSGLRETGDRSRWSRRALVTAEIALAVVLLAGAGLMVQTMRNLLGVDPGFDPRHVLAVDMAFVGPAYAEDSAVRAAQARILDGVRAQPGVDAAAFAGQIPLGGNMDTWGFHAEGHPLANTADAPSVERYGVTPDYFRVMRIPLRRGRTFTDADRESAPLVMVVGETTARRVWPGQDPIGRRVRIGAGTRPPHTVVGVVGDVRHYQLSAAPTAQMYLAQAQLTDSFVTLVARTRGDPLAIANAVRQVVFRAAPGVAPDVPTPLEQLVSKSIAERRFAMLLLAVFSTSALVLALVGVYGTVAYNVSRRTREFGLRIALGARRADIGRLVLGDAARMLTAGIVLGVAGAIAVTRSLGTLLYGVEPGDPSTLAVIVAIVGAATFIAQLTPALRATAVDPSRALQAE